MYIQRFFPSEFGNDVDRVRGVEPAKSAYSAKAKIRRALEGSGIPYTIVSSNFFADWFLSSLAQPQPPTPPLPPKHRVFILGDGNPKGNIFSLTIYLHVGRLLFNLGLDPCFQS